MVTIFRNIYSKEPHYISVDTALERIKSGKSKALVENIRTTLDNEKRKNLKMNLPAICFSGRFGADRKDDSNQEHSGFIVLDFDNVEDLSSRQQDIIGYDFVYACWISPSGNGLKALVRIADTSKHREHFQALKECFPEVDQSGINPSRVCFESFDPELYTYPDAAIFTKLKIVERVELKVNQTDDYKTFKNLLTWLTNRNDAFVKGERNLFIFKLASACCRYGIDEMSARSLIASEFLTDSDFTTKEAERTIKSAYRANGSKAGTCVFDKSIFIDKETRKEVKLETKDFEDDEKVRDVTYGIDVKDKALDIYDKGYAKVLGIGVNDFDFHFKLKRGEITCLTGIGNYGKSTLKKWYQVMRAVLYGEKFATFSPEDNPAEEYYHELTEILLGAEAIPTNQSRPTRESYELAYDFITEHFFYVFPKEMAPTPEYIKEVFLELIIKEKVDGCDIDPFNQLSNDYKKQGGRTDKYLETFLSDCSRFAQLNNVYFLIVAHPKIMNKDNTGNYSCPDVFDINDGAMWNNKMDNILVYHRPFAQSNPQDPSCEFYSKKIRRQRTVGKKGFFLFSMEFSKRRFFFDGLDPLQKVLNEKNIRFNYERPNTTQGFRPYGDW